MLNVKVIMNSFMEEVLSFKCSSLHDQNLEMHVLNRGDHPVTVPGYFRLENENASLECRHLYPPWEQTIKPGEGAAFYCSLDPLVWGQYRYLTIVDSEGNSYKFSIKEITEYQMYPA